jgi:asparagine synthase (glutamine-hydrolysing)
MRPRGPDGAGIWISPRDTIGLAHRRLSIIDLSDAAAQPMQIHNGRYRIVSNGEIYNYQSLRRELEGEGCNFHSTSDTEVLLYLYAKRGADMVHALRGMFAFAIWDESKRGLFLTRDHFGIKPLYIHDDGKTFRCASQVKALMAGNGIKKAIEPAGHVGFFLWGSVPEPYTLYRDIFALPAGHTLWVDGNGSPAPQRYFDVADEFIKAASQLQQNQPVREVLRTALRNSVQQHLIADVPVGVFLSAGVDSGTIAALASEESAHINAVTLGFTEYAGTEQDEALPARRIAARYGCNHHIHHITRQDFNEVMPHILAAMDQPATDGINTWFVAREAAQAGLKVVLSGLGGDELVGGYPGFSQIPKLVKLARIPAAIPGFGKGFHLLSAPLLKYMASPKYAGLFEYGGSYGGAYLLRRSLFMPWELLEILDADMVREGCETLQPITRMDNEITAVTTPHAKISALELTHYMRNTLLRDSDWAGMAHSLEIRTPLVDVGLFRALAPYMVTGENLPSKREMAKAPINPLPDEIINRRKTGFSIPMENWFNSAGQTQRQRGLRGWAKNIYA